MADAINIDADFKDVIDQFALLHQIQGKARQELENYIKASATYDEAGKRVAANVRTQVSEGQDLVGTMKEVTKVIDGVKTTTEVYRFTLVNTNRELQKQKELAKQAADASKQTTKDRELFYRTVARLAAEAEKAEKAAIKSNMKDREIFYRTTNKLALDAAKADEDIRKRTMADRELFYATTAKLQADAAKAEETAKQNRAKQLSTDIKRLGGSVPGGDGSGGPAPTDTHISKVKRYAELLTRIQATLTNLALYRGFNILTNQLTQSVNAAGELETKVALIRTVSQEAQQSASKWADDIKAVSNRTGIAATDIADAFNDAVQNQLASGSGVKEFVDKSADLAKVTNSTAQEAGRAIGAILNTYGTEAGNVDQISAKLFKTIDRGIINMSQLADGFGNVAFLARDLGVPLEEILAALASLTRSGLSTDEAMTLINNGMVKLLKPTDAMTKTFAEMGVSSGKSAVQIKGGLLPVLGEISQLVEQGKIDPTADFNEIRGQKFFAFYQQNIAKLAEDFDAIKNKSGDTFDLAKQIRAEPAADKIKIAATQVQNAIQSSFGQAVNQLAASLVNLHTNAKDLEASFTKWGKAVLFGAGALGTGMIVLRGFAVAQEFTVASLQKRVVQEKIAELERLRGIQTTNQATAAELRLQQAQARTGRGSSLTSFAAANPASLVTTALITGITAYTAYKQASVDTFSTSGQALDDFLNRMKDEKVTKELEKSLDKTREIRETFKDMSKVVGNQLAEAISKNNQSLQGIRDRIRQSQDALKAGFVGALDIARNKVQELDHEFGQIPQRIRDSQKAQVEFADRIQSLRTQTLQKFATPDQSLRLTESEITRLFKRVEDLRKQDTPEAIAEARKIVDQIAQLQVQSAEKSFDIQKTQYERMLQERGESGNHIFVFDDTDLKRRLDSLYAYQNRLEEEYQQKLAKRKETEETEVAKAKEKLKLTEEAITKFENFSALTPEGQVRKEFQTPTGQLDPKKLQEGLKAASDNLRQFVPEDVLSRLNFAERVTERKKLIEEEARRVILNKDLSRAQEDVTKSEEKVGKALAEGEAKVRSYNDAVKTLASDMRVLSNSFVEASQKGAERLLNEGATSGLNNRFSRGVSVLFNDIQNSLQNNSEGDIVRGIFERLQSQASSLDKQLENLPNQTVNRNGRTVIDPEKLKEARAALQAYQEEFKKQVAEAARIAGVGKVEGGSFILPGANQKTVDEAIAGLSKVDEGIKNALSTLEQSDTAFQRFESEITRLNKMMGEYSENHKALTQSAQGLTGGLANVASQQLEIYDQLLARIRDINAELSKSGVATPQVQRKAMGGPVYRNYGGPIGKDNIMMWAQEGEYVVNAAATRRFYSQIVQYNNAGRAPQYFNSGGEVTNMGGVTINVNGAENPNVTARSIDRVLKRSNRMGQSK